MKKIKTFCSAIAAFGMLALAGCDLEVPDSSKVVYKEGRIGDITTLPYIETGVMQKDTMMEALDGVKKSDGTAWSVSDGISFSFALTDYTADWSMIFQTAHGAWGSTDCHRYKDGWTGSGSASGYHLANAWGTGSANANYGLYYCSGTTIFVTISLNKSDGSLVLYKNGTVGWTYSAANTDGTEGFNGYDSAFGSVAEWIELVLNDIAEEGIYCIHPTDSWANASSGDYKMTYFILDAAVDATGAAEKYSAYKTWADAQ